MFKQTIVTFINLASCLLVVACLNGQTTVTLDSTVLTQTDVVTGIQIPWEILWGPDDHIWVTERRGRVLRVEPETGNYNTILNIENQVESGGEPGLLGMTLHPDFENTPLVYLVYNYLPNGGFQIKEKLVSFEWDGTELTNETIVLDDIPGGIIHNGSRLLISKDDKILMTTGDKGNNDLSQDLESLAGKILRLNLDGSIPSDNPFDSSYVYSYGHRNAQGLCHGPNDLIYSSEHGAQQSDEVNLIVSGQNYGWPIVQGACDTDSELNFCNNHVVVEPMTEYSPCRAVCGLDYYDHPAIPEFEGSIVLAVLGGLSGGWERIAVIKVDESGTVAESEAAYFDNFGRLRDVCINPHNGALYIATNGSNYPGSGPNKIIEFRNEEWTMDTTIMDTMIVDTMIIDTMVTDTTIGNAIENLVPTKQSINIYPNPAKNKINFVFSDSFIGETFELINYSGQVVLKDKITSPQMTYDTSEFAAGSYFIKANSRLGTITRTVILLD